MFRIYETGTKVFSNNGLGTVQAYKCTETKKAGLDGWRLDVDLPASYSGLIHAGRIVVAKTKERSDQPFVIRSDIRRTGSHVFFTADHVIFDAANYTVLDSRPTGLGAVQSAAWVNRATDTPSPYTVTGDFAGEPQTHYFIRKTLLACWKEIAESFGCLADPFDWTVRFMDPSSVGRDAGFKVAHGKNLQGYEIEEDWSEVCTKILPVGPEGLLLDPPYVDSGIMYPHGPYTKVVTFQINAEGKTEAELLAILREKAEAYLEEHKEPRIRYTVKSDVPQELGINDVVRVCAPGIEIKANVVEYVYDTESQRVKSLVFGNYTDNKTRLESTVAGLAEETAATVSGNIATARITRYDAGMQRLYNAMANALGLFVTAEEDGSGGRLYYYHDRPSLAASHVVYTINSGGFAVSTDGGQTYTAGMDAQGNAVVNVLSAIGLSADWIEAGVLSVSKDGQETFYVNVDTGEVRIVADAFSLSSGETIENIARDEAGQAVEGVTQRVSQLEVNAQEISSTVSSMQSSIETIQNVQNGLAWRTETLYISVPEGQVPSKDAEQWQSYPPTKAEGYCIWQMTVTETVAGDITKSDPVNMSGTDGRDGESATLLKIDSSRGNLFKRDSARTDLTVTVYHGADRITSAAALRRTYGNTARLQWYWKDMSDDEYREILSTDDRIKNEGFLFEIGTGDVDTKVVLDCRLVID